MAVTMMCPSSSAVALAAPAMRHAATRTRIDKLTKREVACATHTHMHVNTSVYVDDSILDGLGVPHLTLDRWVLHGGQIYLTLS